MPSRTGRLLRARVNSILDGIQMTGYQQTYTLKFFLLYNWMSYLLKEFVNLNGNPVTIAECVKTQLRPSLMAKGYFIFGIRHRSYWALIYTTIIYTPFKKTTIFFLKKRRHVTSLSDQHSILSIQHFPKYLKTWNTLLTTRKDSTNFCLSITHFLYLKGGHFDTKFDKKYSRLMDPEVLLEDNGVIFDDYDHFLIDDPVIDPQKDGDLNIHNPDM